DVEVRPVYCFYEPDEGKGSFYWTFLRQKSQDNCIVFDTITDVFQGKKAPVCTLVFAPHPSCPGLLDNQGRTGRGHHCLLLRVISKHSAQPERGGSFGQGSRGVARCIEEGAFEAHVVALTRGYQVFQNKGAPSESVISPGKSSLSFS